MTIWYPGRCPAISAPPSPSGTACRVREVDGNRLPFLQLLDGRRGKMQLELPGPGLEREHAGRVIDRTDGPAHGVLSLLLGRAGHHRCESDPHDHDDRSYPRQRFWHHVSLLYLGVVVPGVRSW